METLIIIDWISCTAHDKGGVLHAATHPKLLNWDEWEQSSGVFGYTEGATHKTGLKVYQNQARPEMGKHMIYSGKTLQKLYDRYELNAVDILKYHSLRGDSITRLDLALDIKNESLRVQHFIDAYDNGDCVTKLKSASEIKEKTGERGHTFYIGSTKTRKKLVRIYDKRAETGTEIDWIRIELQIMGKPATKLGRDIIESKHMSDIILGAIKEIVDFPTIYQWFSIFDSAESVDIITATDKLGNTREWLDKTVFKSIQDEAKIDPGWFEEYVLSLIIAVRKNEALVK